MDFFLAALGIIVGGFITIATAIFIERHRSPELTLAFEEPLDFGARPTSITGEWRSLRIRVSNAQLRFWASPWLVRLPAQQCRGEIAFLNANAIDCFERPMVARWAGSPEPLVAHIRTTDGNVAAFLTNPTALKTTVDIYPGDSESLDVAVRYDDDDRCYPWNDETYFVPGWRDQNRLLQQDTYLIEVTVSSSGKKRREYFRLSNIGGRIECRLDNPTAEEWRAIQIRTGPL